MRVFVVAGELSGDKLGGALMAGLRQRAPDVRFSGIGGPRMQAQGLASLFPMDELSVMGLTEVLPKYRHLKRRIRETAEAVLQEKPDVLITIDSPDFSLRVAKLVKAQSDLRTVHYVAPTVWAWRPGRAQKMARVIDQVLALFPFEPPYMEAAGMRSDFVGHPVVAEPIPTAEDAEHFREVFDLGQAPLLMVLPGSRRGEVGRLAGPFGDAVARFTKAHPEWRVVLPAAAPVADLVAAQVGDWAQRPTILDPRAFGPDEAQYLKRGAFAAADLALAASGTVSLELAAARTPMVIAYRFSWLSWQIMKRMALIDTVTLVNLVSDTRVVPERLGPDCRGDLIAEALDTVLQNADGQRDAMELTMQRLGFGGEDPGLRAARAVLDGIAVA